MIVRSGCGRPFDWRFGQSVVGSSVGNEVGSSIGNSVGSFVGKWIGMYSVKVGR